MSSSGCSCRTCDGSGWVVRTHAGETPRYDSGGLSIALAHVTTWVQCAECLARLQPIHLTFTVPHTPFPSEAPTP